METEKDPSSRLGYFFMLKPLILLTNFSSLDSAKTEWVWRSYQQGYTKHPAASIPLSKLPNDFSPVVSDFIVPKPDIRSFSMSEKASSTESKDCMASTPLFQNTAFFLPPELIV